MKLSLTKDLEALRAAAKRKVDGGAEAARQLYVTPGSGQAMVYLVKEAQAKGCLADPNPNPADYPLLACTVGTERHPETGAIAQDVTEVAQIVLGMAQQWAQIAAAIETARLGAKNAVDDATTPAQIEAAAAVDWSSITGAS